MIPRSEAMSNDRLAALYIAAIVAGGGWVTGSSLWNVVQSDFGVLILAWAALSVLTLMAGRFTVKLPFLGCRLSISDAFLFLSVILFGVELSALTAAMDGYAASTRQKGTWHKRLFNTAGMALSIFCSARLYGAAVKAARVWDDVSVARVIVPVLVLGAAQFVLNTAIVSAVVRLKDGVSLSRVWGGALRWTGLPYLAGALAAFAISVAIEHAGVVSTFAIMPFPAVLFVLYQGAAARLQVKRAPVRG
jgi:hypothetical protein